MLEGFLASVSLFFVLCSFIVNKTPGLIRSFYALISTALILKDPQWALVPGLLYLTLCFLANALLDHKKHGFFVIILSIYILLVPVQEISPSSNFFLNLATLTLLVYPVVALESYRRLYLYQAVVLAILTLYLSAQHIDPTLELDPIRLSILFTTVIHFISLITLIFTIIGKLEEITAHSIDSEEMLLRSIEVLESACCSRYDSLQSLKNRTDEMMRQQAVIIQSEKLHSLLTLFKGLRKNIEKPLDLLSDQIDALEEKYNDNAALQSDIGLLSDQINKINHQTTNFRKIGNSLNQNWEYLNIKDVIDTTMTFLESSCKEVCRLEVNYDGAQSTVLNPQAINTAILEIINNNIQIATQMSQTRDGEKIIKVSFKTDFNLHIYIENNFSANISSNDLSKSFDMFATTHENGVGLGMSLVFDIISQHKGTISLEKDDKNNGLCHIQLPIKADV